MFTPNDKARNIFVNRGLGKIVFTYMSQSNHDMEASLLIHSENGVSHKMFHRNFTMFRCDWDCDTTFDDKIMVLRGMSEWLRVYNVTLNGHFVETEDYLAWNVAQYNDGAND
tara:strand:- start:2035 stop:2370 length:336 start_codon:yes stop_codon:yes gene_type:complete